MIERTFYNIALALDTQHINQRVSNEDLSQPQGPNPQPPFILLGSIHDFFKPHSMTIPLKLHTSFDNLTLSTEPFSPFTPPDINSRLKSLSKFACDFSSCDLQYIQGFCCNIIYHGTDLLEKIELPTIFSRVSNCSPLLWHLLPTYTFCTVRVNRNVIWPLWSTMGRFYFLTIANAPSLLQQCYWCITMGADRTSKTKPSHKTIKRSIDVLLAL